MAAFIAAIMSRASADSRPSLGRNVANNARPGRRDESRMTPSLRALLEQSGRSRPFSFRSSRPCGVFEFHPRSVAAARSFSSSASLIACFFLRTLTTQSLEPDRCARFSGRSARGCLLLRWQSFWLISMFLKVGNPPGARDQPRLLCIGLFCRKSRTDRLRPAGGAATAIRRGAISPGQTSVAADATATMLRRKSSSRGQRTGFTGTSRTTAPTGLAD